MKRGKHLPCSSCHRQWVAIAYDAPPGLRPLCASCTPVPPKRTPLQLALKCAWATITPRLRLTVAVVWLILYVASVAAMAGVWLVR